MSQIHQTRFSNAAWADAKHQITIGGIGGIGSNLVNPLISVGHELLIYEHDHVDGENCGTQGYDIEDVGLKKFDALQNRLNRKYKKENVLIIEGGFFEPSSLVTNICIACFDNMLARKEMFHAWVNLMKSYTPDNPAPKHSIFIDGRMTAEYYEIFFITNEIDAQKYITEHMFPDKEAVKLTCTYKSTLHTGQGISHKINQGLCNHLANSKTEFPAFIVPFHLTFHGKTFTEEIEYSSV